MKDGRKIRWRRRSDTQLPAAIVVFLTYPVYPFVIQHANRPPAP
jgi:hypothetical protein